MPVRTPRSCGCTRSADVDTLRRELEELIEAVAPSVFDLESVLPDPDAGSGWLDPDVRASLVVDAFDGDCTAHDGCRSVFP